ncbi:hypothetical protein Tco_1431113 [Tanacetum coccineum]
MFETSSGSSSNNEQTSWSHAAEYEEIICYKSDIQRQSFVDCIRRDSEGACAYQVADSAMWDALKAKFKKPSAPTDTCRSDIFQKHDHDDHPDNHPVGDTGPKRQKTAKGSSSANVTSPSKSTRIQKSMTYSSQPNNKRVPTTDDFHRMKDTYDDLMKKFYQTEAEYECHIQKMTDYMNNQIVWESREEDLTTQVLKKQVPDKQFPHGNSKTRKYVLSLYKIHDVPFLKDDLKELLTRWVGRVYKRFNTEAHLSIQHWKSSWGKMFYIRDHTDPFVGIVYENSKKERRVMNIDELQKLCNATLQRVLKNVREINMKARHGFKDPPLREKDKDVMVFFEEEIEERLKYRRQMRSMESFMNGRPIRPLRDRPE